MKKLTEAQRTGLAYLAEATKPSDQRALSSRYISTPRANTLGTLETLGLAKWVPASGRYEITKSGLATL